MDHTDLAVYVGANEDDVFLPRVYSAALELIYGYLGAAEADVPASVLETAILQLGSELWVRRNSPGGIAQWTDEGNPVRLGADPLRTVRPLLARYKGLGAVG